MNTYTDAHWDAAEQVTGFNQNLSHSLAGYIARIATDPYTSDIIEDLLDEAIFSWMTSNDYALALIAESKNLSASQFAHLITEMNRTLARVTQFVAA